MELFIKVFFLLFFAQASLSVLVTLKGGGTGTVNQEIALDTAEYVLQCSLSSSSIGGTPKLEWTYAKDKDGEGSHLYLDGKVVVKYTDKVYFQSPFSLGLKNIQSEDSGYYRCRGVLAGDEPSVDSARYNLIVLVPPSDQISCGFPSDRAITRGESAQFHCAEVVQQANPPPEFRWFKDDKPLPLTSKNNNQYPNSTFSYDVTTGVLKFEKVVQTDQGRYYCTATNKVGSGKCSEAQITIKEVNVGAIVGIVFGVIFGVILIAVLIWWTYRRGYFDGIFGEKDHDDDGPDDGANDIMLDGAGPIVTKTPSEYSNGTSHKDSMRSSGPFMPEGGVRVMP